MANINWNKIKELLKEKTGLGYYNTSKTELITRCLFGGSDHDSSPDHGHLYISMNEDFLVFKCFKCNESGNLLKLLDFYNLNKEELIEKELLERLTNYRYLKYNWNKSKNKIEKNEKEIKIFNEFKLTENYIKKSVYLKSRINFDIDVEDIPDIIFDVKSFIENNNIYLNTYYSKMIDALQTKAIGFLGKRQQIIIFRNIDKENEDDFRYIKIPLSNNNFIFNDFYGIQTDSISTTTNKIVLCEGPFDVLNIYYNNSELLKNSMFIACVFGNNYYNVISSILDYLKLTKAKFVILSDSNMNNLSYKNLRLHPQIENLEICWNKIGKDFGEPTNITFKQTNIFKLKKKKNKKYE